MFEQTTGINGSPIQASSVDDRTTADRNESRYVSFDWIGETEREGCD